MSRGKLRRTQIQVAPGQMQDTEEPTSLVINGSSMVVAATGKPATPSNPDGTVAAGGQQSFEWYIKPDTQEGARFFRSHAAREQFNQGLIGMLVVEPRGSRYLSPFDGKPMASGWEAMIEDPKGADFRAQTCPASTFTG